MGRRAAGDSGVAEPVVTGQGDPVAIPLFRVDACRFSPACESPRGRVKTQVLIQRTWGGAGRTWGGAGLGRGGASAGHAGSRQVGDLWVEGPQLPWGQSEVDAKSVRAAVSPSGANRRGREDGK